MFFVHLGTPLIQTVSSFVQETVDTVCHIPAEKCTYLCTLDNSNKNICCLQVRIDKSLQNILVVMVGSSFLINFHSN